MDYAQKREDPKWERFRQRVLEYHDYECRRCLRTAQQVTLQVHHPFYYVGAEPWDYKVWEVECLCIDCHRKEHGIREESEDDVPF